MDEERDFREREIERDTERMTERKGEEGEREGDATSARKRWNLL